MQNLPRLIDPSVIDIGDTITVELPSNQGIVHIVKGTVWEKEISGNITYYISREGGNILTWFAGMKTKIKVTLVDRVPVKQPELFSSDFLAETRMRIA